MAPTPQQIAQLEARGLSKEQIARFSGSAPAPRDSTPVAAGMPSGFEMPDLGINPWGAAAGAGALALAGRGIKRAPQILEAGTRGGGIIPSVARMAQAYLGQPVTGGPEVPPQAPPVQQPQPIAEPAPKPIQVQAHGRNLGTNIVELSEKDIAEIPEFANEEPGTRVSRSRYEKFKYAKADAALKGEPRKGAKPGAKPMKEPPKIKVAEPSESNLRSLAKAEARAGARAGARPMEPRVPITIHEGEGVTTEASRGATQRGRTRPQLDRIAAERARIAALGSEVADEGDDLMRALAASTEGTAAMKAAGGGARDMSRAFNALKRFAPAAKALGPIGTAAGFGLALPGIVEAAERGNVGETAFRGAEALSPITRQDIIDLTQYLQRRLHPLGQDY